MIDRWTDRLFWPALTGAWAAMLLGLAAAVAPRPFTAWIAPATMALAALALVMFVTMLCDPPTRRAIDSFNRHEDAGPGGAPWRRRSFSANYGDRRLMIVNRLAALALLMVALMGRQDLAVLCFVSVAISALMLMLMLKRRRNGPFRDGG